MFKYAICNELFVDQPIGDVIESAATLGYKGIEIAPSTLVAHASRFEVSDIDTSVRKQVARQAADAGVHIVGLHWLLAHTSGLHLTSADVECRSRTATFLAELAELNDDLGGRVLVLGSPQQRSLQSGVTPVEAWQYALDVVQRAMPRFEKLDVTLALEPLSRHETDFLNTAAQAIRLAQQVGSDRCRLQLDVKAMSDEATSIPEIIRQHRDWLVHFHANDPNLLGPGMGDVDFTPILESLHITGYDDWISVEAFRSTPSAYDVAAPKYRVLEASRSDCLREVISIAQPLWSASRAKRKTSKLATRSKTKIGRSEGHAILPIPPSISFFSYVVCAFSWLVRCILFVLNYTDQSCRRRD